MVTTSRRPQSLVINRRAFTGGLLAGGLGIALSSCSQPGSSNGPDSDGAGDIGSLTWYVNKTPVLTSDLYAGIADGFQAIHDGSAVTVIDQGGQELATYYQTLMTSGNAPDIGTGIAVTDENSELFHDLSSYEWLLEKAAATPLVEASAVGGKYFTCPIGYYAAGLMFYNKQAFRDAGIDAPPSSMDELTEAARSLKSAGIDPIALSGDWALATAIHALARPSIMETDLTWYTHVTDGTASYVGSGYEQAIDLLRAWKNEGLVRDDVLGLKYEVVSNDFLTGRYGMYPMGSFLIGNLDQLTEHADIGVFAPPTFSGTAPAPVVVTGAATWTVPQAAKNVEGGTEFMRYLATDENAIRTYIQANGAFDDVVTYDTSPLGTETQQLLAETPLKSPFGSGDNYELPGTSAQLATAAAKVFTDNADGASVAAEMDTWWQQNAPNV